MGASVQSGPLGLDLPFMDDACAAFTARLAIADEADDAQLPRAWRDLVACAAENFAREDRWMQSTDFSSRKGHILQHRVVLEVMREGIVQADEGRLLQVRQMLWQLRDWFGKHVQTADAALALHLRGARFDPANGETGPAGSATGAAARA